MGFLKKLGEKKWVKTLASVAPTVATALSGPVGGLAMTVLKDALGNPEMTDNEVEAQIMQGNPDTFLALKQAENNFTVKMRELDIKEDDLVYQDIKSAREMQMKTNDPQANYLTWAVISIFFLLSATVIVGLFFPNHFQLEGPAERIVYLLLGLTGGWVGQIMNFRFGSSRGSLLKSIDQAEQLRQYVKNGK